MIDAKWKDHLRNMDGLRDVIWTQGMAQRDPVSVQAFRGDRHLDHELAVDARQVVAKGALRAEHEKLRRIARDPQHTLQATARHGAERGERAEPSEPEKQAAAGGGRWFAHLASYPSRELPNRKPDGLLSICSVRRDMPATSWRISPIRRPNS